MLLKGLSAFAEGKSEPHKADNEKMYRTEQSVVTTTETSLCLKKQRVKRVHLSWKSQVGTLT